MTSEHAVSERSACREGGIARSVVRYQAKIKDDNPIIEQLRQLAQEQPRWGFRKMYHHLRNQGYGWNHKRIYRVYCNMKLNLRIRKRKRIPKRFPQPLSVPGKANECWSMDFMADVLVSGQRFRTLNIMDDYNREVLAIEVDTSLPAQRVVRILERIADWRGLPQRIRVDNGTEFTGIKLYQWAQRNHVHLDFIQPGSPAQNAFIERLNRTYREEVLDLYLFRSLKEVRRITHNWIHQYNHVRPHEALGGQSPTMLTQPQAKLSTLQWY